MGGSKLKRLEIASGKRHVVEVFGKLKGARRVRKPGGRSKHVPKRLAKPGSLSEHLPVCLSVSLQLVCTNHCLASPLLC